MESTKILALVYSTQVCRAEARGSFYLQDSMADPAQQAARSWQIIISMPVCAHFISPRVGQHMPLLEDGHSGRGRRCAASFLCSRDL